MTKQSSEQPPSSWELIEKRIEALRDQAFEKLDNEYIFNRVAAFARKLQTHHPDYQKYKCYHALISSTYPPGSLDGDFEGKDSVEAFFESLLTE